MGKESACNAGDAGRHGFSPQVKEIPWRGTWQPTPITLPGESHGQRSLAVCSPWGHKESNTTKHGVKGMSMKGRDNLLMRRSELDGSHPKRYTGFGVKQTWILSFPSWVSGLAFLSLGSSTKPGA